jgi:hypothetical protein
VDDLYRPVVVAVVAVRVMQVTRDEVVDVIPVRYRVVPALRPVLVTGFVVVAIVLGCAVRGVPLAHLERVLLDLALAVMVQLAVV